MGGQACVLHGAMETTRDLDLAVAIDAENLDKLKAALDELQAYQIAVPPFEKEFLARGHAVHFRCRHPEAANLRIDVMTVMRGVDEIETIWSRRKTFEIGQGEGVDVIAIEDLVRAKKTQRDKDWPMIRRLVEVDYYSHEGQPSEEKVDFWLREARSPEHLIEIAKRFPERAAILMEMRPLLKDAINENREALMTGLLQEELNEREKDRQYWLPLRQELEQARHTKKDKEVI